MLVARPYRRPCSSPPTRTAEEGKEYPISRLLFNCQHLLTANYKITDAETAERRTLHNVAADCLRSKLYSAPRKIPSDMHCDAGASF